MGRKPANEPNAVLERHLRRRHRKSSSWIAHYFRDLPAVHRQEHVGGQATNHDADDLLENS
jgi:hypothetical protein